MSSLYYREILYIVKYRLEKGGEWVQETVNYERTVQPITLWFETCNV